MVLAGGRGMRMGGADKGLLDYQGRPLVLNALDRLRPQVDRLAINANRHLDAYRAFGVPVLTDADDQFSGPLAGMLAGLAHCGTRWLAVVPCDAPHFPLDLVARLAAGRGDAPAALPLGPDDQGALHPQPVFCLLDAGPDAALAESLRAYMAEGGRKAGEWLARVGAARVAFGAPGDAGAFFNANRPGDLAPHMRRA